MGKTSIEWATHTVNWLAGCTRVSPACQHCYAETMTARLAKMPQAPARYRDRVVEDRRWTGRISYDSAVLANGLGIVRRPGVRVFANSMSDTFHEHVPATSLTDLAEVIRALTPSARGALMLLTKRPERMLAWQRKHFPAGLPAWVWVGCTVEDQQRADERIPVLLQVDAHVRYLSCEPLLGPIVFGAVGEGVALLSWVIAGGESGPKARPSHPDWFRSLRDQCAAANVPFHFKQWGEWADDAAVEGAGLTPRGWHEASPEDGGRPAHDWPGAPPVTVWRVGKHAAGRLLDGRTHDGLPVVP